MIHPSQNPDKNFRHNQILVLFLTFIAYASFHASRKPPSIVKSILGPDSSGEGVGWAPFNGPRGPHRLGETDLAFLSAYAVGMYFSGQVADRFDLRLFLLFGMLGSAVTTILFGLEFWFETHQLGFFLIVQVLSGLFQSVGWPCVVSIVGNWFMKSKRGLVMGVWNSHTSFGNIVGSIIASSALGIGWGWSFVFPGILVGVTGILVFKLLIVSPGAAGFERDVVKMGSSQESEEKADEMSLLQSASGEKADAMELLQSPPEVPTSAIGFLEAWRLPGVGSYAFSLFFSKLVAYTFLYWLPFYIRHTAVAGVHLTHKAAGMLSAVFDLGGVCGGAIAGYLSDVMGANGATSVVFLLLSVPILILYRIYGGVSTYINIGLMFLTGFFVNGPYSLITTAVATDLGTQSCIHGNSRALATVTAIIDGTGSVGAALGPLLTGYLSTSSWNGVFVMLISASIIAGSLLIHIAKAEIKNTL